jgi:hypothetical protein
MVTLVVGDPRLENPEMKIHLKPTLPTNVGIAGIRNKLSKVLNFGTYQG